MVIVYDDKLGEFEWLGERRQPQVGEYYLSITHKAVKLVQQSGLIYPGGRLILVPLKRGQ